MTINYSNMLTDDQKRSILEQRLAQFAAEAYQYTLNLQIAQTSNNTEGVQQANDALAILDTAITVHQDELAKLPASNATN